MAHDLAVCSPSASMYCTALSTSHCLSLWKIGGSSWPRNQIEIPRPLKKQMCSFHVQILIQLRDFFFHRRILLCNFLVSCISEYWQVCSKKFYHWHLLRINFDGAVELGNGGCNGVVKCAVRYQQHQHQLIQLDMQLAILCVHHFTHA